MCRSSAAAVLGCGDDIVAGAKAGADAVACAAVLHYKKKPLQELKDVMAEVIEAYEEDNADSRKMDTLTEALDALEDAYEGSQ